MNALGALMATASMGAGAYFLWTLPSPSSWGMATAFGLLSFHILVTKRQRVKVRRTVVVRLKGLSWTREDFCRGWLITGDTGSCKTRSGITPLLYQVFKNEPRWGGVCIADHGISWETLQEMDGHFSRQNESLPLT